MMNDRERGYKKTVDDEELNDIDEEPPTFDEMKPLLELLAKYIRDDLRKRKKRSLTKKDFLKPGNFHKFIKRAIDKRNKVLGKRQDKMHHVADYSKDSDESDMLDPSDVGRHSRSRNAS